ncbi:MAG: hypothetical protein CVT90_00425 [Candidatus Altiarchaeales archaeon HGW-Altiarchaeales-3]|nr:MAG: hypothetical protein CVT90_00425 [Candidatus Altiarchaeales archaeon HGW-Altiarchaeales-3]
MFCPKCGKIGDGLCAECYLKGNFMQFKKTTITACSCGKIYMAGSWIPESDIIIEKQIKQNLYVPPEINVKKVVFEIISPGKNNKRIFLKIQVSGKYYKEDITTEIDAEIGIIHKTCELCGKRSGNYYEATIQLRDINSRGYSDITKFIDLKNLSIDPEFIDPDFITKVDKVKGGIDIYLTSQAYAREIETKFRAKGFATKTSAKLMGQKDGKEYYRIAISIKPPRFNPGDFVKMDKRILLVVETGRNVICKDPGTQVTKTISHVKIQNAELVVNSDVRTAIISFVSPDEIQVLDLKSYETIEFRNKNLISKLDAKAGDEIRVLKFEGRNYVV